MSHVRPFALALLLCALVSPSPSAARAYRTSRTPVHPPAAVLSFADLWETLLAFWTGWAGAPARPGAALHSAAAADTGDSGSPSCGPGSPEATVETCQTQPDDGTGSGPQIDPNGANTGKD